MNDKTSIFERNLLSQIVAYSPTPILVATKDAKIMYVNPSWEKLTGYSKEKVKGKNPHIVSSGLTSNRVYKQLWKSLLSGHVFSTDKIVNKRKSGRNYRIRTEFYPIIQNGEIHYFAQEQHDITQQKKLDKFKKDFLFEAGHELKTPLTVLKLITDKHLNIAKKNGQDTIKVNELEIIDRELNKLLRLISDILDSSRFENGKQFMQFKEVDLVKVIIDTIVKLNFLAANHKIVLENFPKHVFIVADEQRIEQVIFNLISNAIKYSPIRTSITVMLRHDRNHVVLSIKDEGIGISKQDQKSIFDRYYRVKNKNNLGFGLGLYITKQIVKRHRGKIWVDSEKGKGSTFYVRLPMIV